MAFLASEGQFGLVLDSLASHSIEDDVKLRERTELAHGSTQYKNTYNNKEINNSSRLINTEYFMFISISYS
jgi:hypothetical protein